MRVLRVYVLKGDSEGERGVCMCMHLWVYCECMYSVETARESVMCWPKQKLSKVHFIFIASSACSEWAEFLEFLGRDSEGEHVLRITMKTFSKVSDNVPKSQWECSRKSMSTLSNVSFATFQWKRHVRALSFELWKSFPKRQWERSQKSVRTMVMSRTIVLDLHCTCSGIL